MSTVYYRGGMLALLGDDRETNEMSFKPTNDRAFDEKTRYWGRVNDFNYSLPWEKVTCVVVGSNVGDKVFVDDNPQNEPLVHGRLSLQSDFTAELVATLAGGDGTDLIKIKPNSVLYVLPKVGGGSRLGVAGLSEELVLEDAWEDVALSLLSVGWLQHDPEASAGAIIQ